MTTSPGVLDPGGLFETHFDDVYAYLAYRVAPDRETARDLAQDVFEAALRSRGVPSDRAAERPWLLRIARNKVADHFRRRRRGRLRAGQDAAVRRVAAPDAAAAEETRRERAQTVARVVRRLHDDQVGLLEEKYLDGLSVGTMAERRGTSEKAVESALSRARDAFRKAWDAVSTTHEGAAP